MAYNKVYHARWYQKHRDEQRARVKKRRGALLVRFRRLIRFLKASPCADCHQRYPYYVMDFDHLAEKESSVALMGTAGISKVIAEILKCEVVCANCHRERTHQRATN